MAITANKLIYDLLEIASSGYPSNEFKVSTDQILHWFEQTRAILIGQSLNKRDDIFDTNTQYIDCLQLEQIDPSLCCEAPSGCIVLRSILQLPSTIDTWKDNWIIGVSGMDGTSISKSNPIKQKYQKYNKYTKNKKSWYLKDGYLYIINDVFMELCKVALIAEFPSDLGRFINCSGTACWTLDSPYPISASMSSQITDILLRSKINPFMTYPADTSNDASGATPQQRIQNLQSRLHRGE